MLQSMGEAGSPVPGSPAWLGTCCAIVRHLWTKFHPLTQKLSPPLPSVAAAWGHLNLAFKADKPSNNREYLRMTWGLIYSRRRLGSQEPCLFYCPLCSSWREKPQSLFFSVSLASVIQVKTRLFLEIHQGFFNVCLQKRLWVLHQEGLREMLTCQRTRKWELMLPAGSWLTSSAGKPWTSVRIPSILWRKWARGWGRWGRSSGSKLGYQQWRPMLSVISSCCMWVVCSQQLVLENQIKFLCVFMHIFVSLHKTETLQFLRITPPSRIIGIWQSLPRKSQEPCSPSATQASAEASMRFLPLSGDFSR